ncbi:MAG: selenoneine biosynthesis selenosugar synthase SenB [Pirellulaceae bacterium]
MRIQIITTNPTTPNQGNAVTAKRWSRFCRQLGHVVRIDSVADFDKAWNADVLVALHAEKSADAMRQFRQDYPQRPIVLMLTGTDIYGQKSQRAVRKSIAMADRLVVLQSAAIRQLSESAATKTHVILQSAEPLSSKPMPLRREFEISVVGHLRLEKDPFRPALASAELPPDSRIRIRHYGAALSREFARQAKRLSATLPRYHWFGPYARWKTVRRIARSQLLIQPSRSEGGASVLSEALVNQTPVLASRIPGNTGILGEDYPGLFAVEDTTELARLMLRFETDRAYRTELQDCVRRLAKLFTSEREAQAIQELLASVRSQ